jgi:hypothetical protein
MIITLTLDSCFFEYGVLRETMEKFFSGEITHRQAASALKRTPEEVSMILGALFVIGNSPKADRPKVELKTFPGLSMTNPYHLPKAHFLAGHLPEDMVNDMLEVLSEGDYFKLQQGLKTAADELRSQEN